MSLVETKRRPGVSLRPATSAQNEVSTPSGVVPLSLRIQGKVGAETLLKILTGSENSPRFEVTNDGLAKWGGGAAPTDILLGRASTGHLRETASAPQLSLLKSGQTQPSIVLNASGTDPLIALGPGGSTAPDVNIGRDSSGRFTFSGGVAGTQTVINTSTRRTNPLLQVYAVDRATGAGGGAEAVNITKIERQVNDLPANGGGHALGVNSMIGDDGTAVVATCHGITSFQRIHTVGNANSEFTPLAVYQADFTTANEPRDWLTDFIQVGPVGQPDLLNGFTVCMNNHFNGAPADSGLSSAVEITTQRWAPSWANPLLNGADDSRATYPIACGVHITGSSNTNSIGGNERDGFSVGLRVGGRGHAWTNAGQRVGKAIEISDWRTQGLHVSGRFAGSTGPAVQVDAGFGEIVGLNGVVTKVKAGIPTDADFDNEQSGMIAVDTTNSRIYVRVGTTWKFAALT